MNNGILDPKDSMILHIPHSSLYIPDFGAYKDLDLAHQENLKLTDRFSDIIFNIEGIDKLIFPYSRIYCDVERYEHDFQEPMAEVGRGWYYTKTDSGLPLRDDSQRTRAKIIYDLHHYKLASMVQDKIKETGMAIIIDCHTFSDTPFETDLDKTLPRPDFCIGFNPEKSVKDWAVTYIKGVLEERGYTVGLNTPYSGSIVPINFVNSPNVASLMIEVNRKLILKDPDKQLPVMRELIKEVLERII